MDVTPVNPGSEGAALPEFSAFSRVPQRSVTATAVDQIKRMIASGVLRPGEKLPTERELAEMLGVSRPTTREVVRALEALGVVATRHGSGTYVTSLSAEALSGPLVFVLDLNRDALDELFAVRVLLEAGAAQAAAITNDGATLERLRELIEAMREATDADGLLAPDLAFHHLIHVVSGNRLLLALMDNLRVLTRESLLVSAAVDDARAAAVEEHETILAALAARNPAEAGAAMRAHVENARKRAKAAAATASGADAREEESGDGLG